LKYLLKNARKWLKYARKALVIDRKVKNIENSEISLTGSPLVPSIDRITSVSRWYIYGWKWLVSGVFGDFVMMNRLIKVASEGSKSAYAVTFRAICVFRIVEQLAICTG
jgi:hypothetical protein